MTEAFAAGSKSSQFAGEPLVLTAGILYKDRDDLRFQQSLVFAEHARDRGVPVIFVDGSTEANGGETWVEDAHRARGGIVVSARIGGIATQAQQGVGEAVNHGATKVVRTESDTKVELPFFAWNLANALDEVDVLVVGRTEASRNSMPETQQRTEEFAGWILQNTLYMPADALAGPRGYTVAGAEVLADYPATKTGMNNWIYMYDTTLEARRRGLPIGGTEIDFRYPTPLVIDESVTQREFFDGKRYDQFALQLGHLLPQVRDNDHAPERAREIAQHVLVGLDFFKSDATTAQKAEAFGDVERWLSGYYGYEVAERLRVQ
jgi:hypothetical protein